MSTKPKTYIDACCFIEAVKHRRGVPLSGDKVEAALREKDCWFFKKLCDASRGGALQLFTSMLSVAECLHVDEVPGPSQETRDLFVEFLTSGTVVDLVEPDIFVAERARDLLWVDKIRLSGADAIHVASAMLSQCSQFLTIDSKIRKQKLSTAIPQLKTIGLTVIRPSETDCLPPEYRTDDLFKDQGSKADQTQPQPGEGRTPP
jgi:hypothetical protein